MSSVNEKIKEENIQNNQMDPQISENKQRLEVNKSEKRIINEKAKLSVKDHLKKEIIIFKKSIPLWILLIIGASIILVICLIVVIVVTNKKNKKLVLKEEEKLEIIPYEEAEKLLGLNVKENHNLLNESSNNINELISICNKEKLTLLNNTINKIPKNLDFLKNRTAISLIVAKEDLDLYMIKISNLSDQTNNLTKEMNDIMDKISLSLNEYKDDINNMISQYKNNIRYLVMPLSVRNSSNLRKLISEELMVNYSNEVDRMNNFYNDYFNSMKEESLNLTKIIKGIKGKIESINNKVNETISNAGEILFNIGMDNIHERFIQLKELFISYNNDLKVLKNETLNIDETISTFKDSLSQEESDILENIKNLMSQMGNSFKNLIPVILSFIDVDKKVSLKKSKVLITLAIYLLELKINEFEIINVEVLTSLDLLFIVDTTASMIPYIETIKKNMINIINNIIKECPGININLGFIGYKDYYESYYNIEFTQNHTYLNDIISNVFADGGGYNSHTDEDVAFAFDLALKKKWISNAKLAVFIADAPAH